MTSESSVHLIVRRTIRASPARLFEAWTQASQLKAWWGPKGVRCTHAEVDARVGGRYRIKNELPDGQVIWIEGEFLEVFAPTRLVYSWQVNPGPAAQERVTVRFEAGADGTTTEVIVVHERIADERTRDGHMLGWDGCLDGLRDFV